MNFNYISPSVLPSRSANTVHVLMQCDALARQGANLILYAKRLVQDIDNLKFILTNSYGIDPSSWQLISYYSRISYADTFRIAALALLHLHRSKHTSAILSRNLYAAYFLAVIQRRPILFETHQLECGFHKMMQKAIMTRPWVITVVISDSLISHLCQHHGVGPHRSLVLHDAAPEGICIISRMQRRTILASLVPVSRGSWNGICAYFGHLYPGRGIEIIEAMAMARRDILFLVYGGNESDILQRQKANKLDNLCFMGYVTHVHAREVMVAVDVLLMPYQDTVSIGIRGHDTSGWMSPMKMFEYLASGVPIISSDLPVLREVLRDGENCLLVPPDSTKAWLMALDRLLNDVNLADRLGFQGHEDYLNKHTWGKRASILMKAAAELI